MHNFKTPSLKRSVNKQKAVKFKTHHFYFNPLGNLYIYLFIFFTLILKLLYDSFTSVREHG
jgi:hypothetical protein